MRFLFVHGTGVRRDGYDPLFGRVCRELLARFPDAETVPCYWGDDHGATLGAGGASIPGFPGLPSSLPATSEQGYGGPVVPGPETLVSRSDGSWTLLYVDPLCELRVLAELPVEDEGFESPGFRSPGAAVAAALAGLANGTLTGSPENPSPAGASGGTSVDGTSHDVAASAARELSGLLVSIGLATHMRTALRQVADSPEFDEACERAVDPATAAELTAATARAVAAALLISAGPTTPCTADERDRVVELLADLLGGTARGPLGRAAGVLGKLGMRMGGQYLLNRHRGALTVGLTPALGDILRYQARGGPLRRYLTERIAASPGPTVVIGHSLGGIALVDLLALAASRQEVPEGLRLLVTVGSQAPYLHELGALHGLEPGAALPDGFPEWLNIYDPNDLLGYRAGPVFPGDARITDHEVTSRQPFPYSHSAYFGLPALYDRIATALADTPGSSPQPDGPDRARGGAG